MVCQLIVRDVWREVGAQLVGSRGGWGREKGPQVVESTVDASERKRSAKRGVGKGWREGSKSCEVEGYAGEGEAMHV